MHQHPADTDDCANSHHGAHLDARADLDSHGGTHATDVPDTWRLPIPPASYHGAPSPVIR